MKKNRILIISIVLAIAFVACPIESTRNITAGIGFILGAVSAAWLGVRQRKGAQQEYADTVRRYTGTTMMKVVWIEESVNERWEQQEDGSWQAEVMDSQAHAWAEIFVEDMGWAPVEVTPALGAADEDVREALGDGAVLGLIVHAHGSHADAVAQRQGAHRERGKQLRIFHVHV